MLRTRAIKELASLGGCLCQSFLVLVRAPIADEEEGDNAAGKYPGDKCVHCSAKSQAYESKAHDDGYVNDGEHDKCVTEWSMNHVPKMKYTLRLIKKDNSF